MDEKEIITQPISNKGISINELTEKVLFLWKYFLSKWVVILIFGFGGAAIGLLVALGSKAEYKAHLSFALIDNAGGGSGLIALASSFGLGNFGGNNDAFSGDNLLEIIQSRFAIEHALLIPVNYQGKTKNLVEVYIDFNELRDKWKTSKKNIELRTLTFPIGQKRATFTRTQDSVLNTIYNDIKVTGALSVARIDKKIGIVNVDFTSKDELFSKLFVETLMDETYRFYKDTRTSQSKANVNMMQVTADSIKKLYETALFRGATYSKININAAIQTAAVPRIKQENSAQLYATVYTEVLKNLESLKLDLARQTPLVQIIDVPRLPLQKEKLGKTMGTIIGGLLGGFFILFWLLGVLYFNTAKKENKLFQITSSYK
jgi:uncharacterized protein YerC